MNGNGGLLSGPRVPIVFAMSSEPTRRYWETLVTRLAWQINAVAFFERCAPIAFIAFSTFSLPIYAIRRSGGSALGLLYVIGIVVFIVGVLVFIFSRKAFFDREQVTIWLEFRLGLNSRLSAARAGLVSWPSEPQELPQLLRRKLSGPLGWATGSLAVLAAAVWIPVTVEPFGVSGRVDQPPALAQTETWLEQLAQLNVVSAESLEKFSERSRELTDRTPEAQYEHSALEAADALRDQVSAAALALSRSFDAVGATLSPLENPDSMASDAELKAAGEQLASALREMREGPLSARADLLKSLSDLSMAGMRGLSPEQASDLRQRLANAGRETRGVVGAAGDEAEVASGEGDPVPGGRGYGAGGVQRGPGQAPLMFSDTLSNIGTGRGESLTNDDLSRASLGDLLGTQRGEHDVDTSRPQGLSAAGALAAPAGGGDSVWVDRLTPGERAALKDFFK